jgi:hypothetical protein
VEDEASGEKQWVSRDWEIHALFLLRLEAGDCDGLEFIPVWPDRSGLLVPGDATSLTTTDLNQDGWPDFVVGVNNGPPVAFQRADTHRRRPLTIRLKGSRGNPSAVGARMTVQWNGGIRHTAEVYAGDGNLSQSPPAVSFPAPDDWQVEQVRVDWPGPEPKSTEIRPRSSTGLLVIPMTDLQGSPSAGEPASHEPGGAG